ncbi:uncharacterized protein VTP21DRAFT_10414 [Calcarisporiella thermophila]|uniref:uncharacterized protein n=1 Tax=Calcarisporiella thermophila TaxID=911321 RepID=UPI00374305F8
MSQKPKHATANVAGAEVVQTLPSNDLTDENARNMEPPLKKKELYGWYAYAFASEVYVVVSLTTFIPVLLEQLASENGVLLPDKQKPCRDAKISDGRCVLQIGWWWTDTASFSLYIFAFSVLLQAITVISMSGAADHGGWRKSLLLGFAWAGSITTMCFIFVTNHMLLFAGLLAIVSNVCFGASVVCANGFLPLLARNHPEVRELGERSALLPTQKRVEEIKERVSTRISATGMAIGYLGGFILLFVCILVAYAFNSSTFSLKLGIFLSGLWWFCFTLIPAIYLKSRPGPPLPQEELLSSGCIRHHSVAYVVYSWRKLAKTVMHARGLSNAFWFLIAWFLLSDGYTTITSTAILFAKTTLHVPNASLVVIAFLSPSSAFAGSLIWPRIQKILGLSVKHTIIMLLSFLVVVPLYGCLDLIPWFHEFGPLTTVREIYILAVYFGSLLGALQGYCRTLFGEIIPKGREVEFYALYAVTDKGSSWLGPFLVGAITDRTHNIRNGFVIILVLLLLPIPILLRGVDVEKGREESRNEAADPTN